ncbi:MAG: hypothetical protein WCF25_03700 [Acidimicrobiales bacterium]
MTALPDDLSEEQIIRPELLLWERGPLSIYVLVYQLLNARSGVFGHPVRGFRTPRGAVGGRGATDVFVSG